jgi:hypothetical protein
MSNKNANDVTLVPIGTELGNFQVDVLLGEGGFGAVFRAHNKVTRRLVAVKFLKAEGLTKDALARFKREAFISNEIDNEHLIQTYEYGEHNGCPFIIMEFLEGATLRKVVEDNHGLPPQRIRNIAIQVAEALAAAHSRNVIHRDLKPDNIYLITRGGQSDFVKVLDFGIAKFTDEMPDKLKTATQTLVGTPYVMSPEQCRGSAIDHRSDVYALGVNLYYLLTGGFPFVGNSYLEIVSGHLRDPVPILPTTGEGAVPSDMAAIVMKAMSKRPEDRFQTMEEMRAALVAARIAYPRRRAAPRLAAAALVALAVSVGGALAYWKLHEPAPMPMPMPHPVPAPAEQWRVFIEVTPTDAELTIDGARRAERPAVVEGSPGKRFHVEVNREGFESQKRNMVIEHEDKSVAFRLMPVAPAAAIPPSESTHVESAKLVINVQPWADVLVDGVKKDTAPCSVRIPAGTHKISLVNGALHRREEIKVTLAGGAVKKIDRDWRPRP